MRCARLIGVGSSNSNINSTACRHYRKQLRPGKRLHEHGRSWSSQQVRRNTEDSERAIPDFPSNYRLLYKGHPIFVNDLKATLEAHRECNRADDVRTYPRLGFATNEHSELVQTPKLEKTSPWWNASAVAELDGFKNTQVYEETRLPSAETPPILEYEGKAQQCQKQWSLSGMTRTRDTRPWLSQISNLDEDPYDRLSSEIMAFESYMRLSPEEETARRLLYQDVSDALGRGCQTRMVGPHSTGLTTPTSTPIISVSHNSRSHSNERVKRSRLTLHQFVQYKLGELPNKFSSTRWVSPAIQVRHKATGLGFLLQEPVQFDMQAEITRINLQEYPTLRALYIALRYFLEIRDLTNPAIGGLDSYPLLVMISAALQKRQYNTHDETKQGQEKHSLLGEQLLYFLRFWGWQLMYHDGYTADPFCKFPKVAEEGQDPSKAERQETWISAPRRLGLDSMQKLDTQRPYLLCLQDPADYGQDLGKHAYKIKHIQATFKSAYQRIKNDLAMADKYRSYGKAKPSSFLCHLLEANYEPLETRRKQVAQFASNTSSQRPGDRPDLESEPTLDRHETA